MQQPGTHGKPAKPTKPHVTAVLLCTAARPRAHGKLALQNATKPHAAAIQPFGKDPKERESFEGVLFPYEKLAFLLLFFAFSARIPDDFVDVKDIFRCRGAGWVTGVEKVRGKRFCCICCLFTFYLNSADFRQNRQNTATQDGVSRESHPVLLLCFAFLLKAPRM